MAKEKEDKDCNRRASEDNVEKLREYLENTTPLPVSGTGKLNLSVIALEAGLSRQTLFKNQQCRAMLEVYSQRSSQRRGINAKTLK